MNQSKFNQPGEWLESTFAQAIEIASAEDRKAFIDEACGTNAELRTRVERLIEAHEREDALFDGKEDVADAIIPQATIPESFGEFDVMREIGRGGMGIVYEARQKSLNRRVALKVLTVGLNFSKASIARFQREAQAAARLFHTNIVPIHTTGVQNQIPYYAMELVRGPSLDVVLEQLRGERSRVAAAEPEPIGSSDCDSHEARQAGNVETVSSAHGDTFADSSSLGYGTDFFDTVARMIAEVADALDHAHKEGVIHRDIKPSNLLLGPDGRMHVSDFGLARIVEEPSVTVTGELMGSPRYMSPEQISSDFGEVDHRTDIYSLGVTLYELITLKHPFDAGERDRVMSQVLHKQPVAPRRIKTKIPVDLETICQKAIEKSPAERYQKASELAEDLRRFVNRRSIAAKRIGCVGHSIRWCRRNRSVAILTALLVVAFACGISLIAWQRGEQQHHWELTKREIESLTETDPWIARLRIDTALEQFPNRQADLASLRNATGRELGILTDVPGAKISVRPRRFSAGEEWLSLGKTPLRTNLPRDHYHVRATLAGHEGVVVNRNTWGRADLWQLHFPTHAGMVRVPRSHLDDDPYARRIIWLMKRKIPPTIPVFHIDRHEVTNGQFWEFVHDQGYYRKELWLDTLGQHWNEVVEEFTDARGESLGPAQWVNGTYPPGMKDHPVVGVSWYEAMAYANWAGKQLPTLYHWLRGANYNGWARDYDSNQRYNIGARRLTHRSVKDGWRSANAYGALDMQGNVKEWCLNEMQTGTHYAMGGCWRDEDGSGYDPVSFKTTDRRVDVGFRCAIYEPNAEWAAALPVQWREIPSEPKAIAAEYVRQFRFDRAQPWNAAAPAQVTFHGVEAQRVQFDAGYGTDQRITCYVIFPDRDRYAPPYQVMLGTSPIFLDDDGNPRIDSERFDHYSPMLKGGRALILPTLWGSSYDRPADGFDPYHIEETNSDGYVDGVVKMAKDVIRTVDFLHEEYPKVTGEDLLDMNKLIFVSCACFQSECMIVADKLVTHENRFAAAFFVLGGIRNEQQPPKVDQLTYLPHVDTPTVIINFEGNLIPQEFAQRGMMSLLPLPQKFKKLYSIPGWQWTIPLEHIEREVNSWLDQLDTLGKPKTRLRRRSTYPTSTHSGSKRHVVKF